MSYDMTTHIAILPHTGRRTRSDRVVAATGDYKGELARDMKKSCLTTTIFPLKLKQQIAVLRGCLSALSINLAGTILGFCWNHLL